MLPSLYGGGAEKIASKLMHNLVENDHSVSLLLLESGGPVQVNKNIKKKVMSRLDGKYSNLFYKLIYSVYYYVYYQLYVLINRDEIVVSFLDRANILNLLPSFGNHKKIISIRSHLSSKLHLAGKKGSLLRFFYKLLFYYADHIIVPSLVMKEDIIENFKQPEYKVVYIPNGLDFNDVKSRANESIEFEIDDILDKYRTVINVGSLSKAKRQDKLITGFYQYLKKSNDRTKLLILGEGEKLDSHIKLVEKLGLKAWSYLQNSKIDDSYDVFFLGYKENPYKYIFKSDVFVLTSEREGFPNVLVEALYLDTYIISSNCKSGPMEILSNVIFNDSVSKATVVDYGTLLPVPEHENFTQELATSISFSFQQISSKRECKKFNKALQYSDDNFYNKWDELLKRTHNEG